MKNSNLISIIVPVYNVELYIRNCLNSLINQTYKNIEIIIIDDGSTDDSYKICCDFEKNDSRIRLYKKANGGLSSARNYGLDCALGDYISFVDSDDQLDLNYIDVLYNNILKTKAEISLGKIQKIYDNKIRKCHNNIITFYNSNYDILNYLSKSRDYYACGILFKKSLFDNIRFPEGKFYEDIGTTYKLYSNAEGLCCTNYDGYLYFIRNNSISMQHSEKKLLDGIDFLFKKYTYIRIKYPNMKSNLISINLDVIDFTFRLVKNNIVSNDSKIVKDIILKLININGNKFKLFNNLGLKSKIKYIYIMCVKKG